MRICFVSHATSHFTTPYVDYFSDLGHEVHLVSLFRTDVPKAVNHHPLRMFSRPGVRTLTYLRALLPVRRAVRSIAPGLVHAHYLTSNGVLAAFAGCRPLILSAHGSDLHQMSNPLRRAAVAYALRRADLVNPVSLHMRNVLSSLGVAPARLLTLSQGVDTTRFVVDRSRRREGPAQVLCTRRLEAPYNCIAIVQALSILKERRVACHVTFAGTGPQEARLKREVSQRGLGADVTFLGGYRQDELPSLLARADIYVSAKPT